MKLLYEIFLSSYLFGIKVSAFFGNEKARKWLDGRKGVFTEITNELIGNSDKIAWFHAASLGEFEMGKPLMEELKTKHGYKLFVTFFSPSGYEYRKDNALADFVHYLPFDRKKNAAQFLDLVNPQLVFFIKNEFWMNYLFELKQRAIPTYLISGIFRANHPFFQYYGGFFHRGLEAFDHMFVQNETSRKLLEKTGFDNVSVAGDLRIDRTYENAQSVNPIACLENFSEGKPVVILGSSWEKEESYISKYLSKYPGKIKVIIAPHDISEKRIEAVRNQFHDSLLFSSFENDHSLKTDVLIVNSIGKLMAIYQYGDVSFVGGAWGDGLHNILEPAAFGIPIIFGPIIHKFPEAFELISEGGAYSVDKFKDFESVLTKLIVESASLNNSGSNAKKYIESRIGVTERIMTVINKKRGI